MSGIKFVHVPMDMYFDFIKGAAKSEDIVECATYLNMKENKIYFVERPKHGGIIHGDVILSDSCKAISSMGLS
jgi:hypothetical protein